MTTSSPRPRYARRTAQELAQWASRRSYAAAKKELHDGTDLDLDTYTLGGRIDFIALEIALVQRDLGGPCCSKCATKKCGGVKKKSLTDDATISLDDPSVQQGILQSGVDAASAQATASDFAKTFAEGAGTGAGACAASVVGAPFAPLCAALGGVIADIATYSGSAGGGAYVNYPAPPGYEDSVNELVKVASAKCPAGDNLCLSTMQLIGESAIWAKVCSPPLSLEVLSPAILIPDLSARTAGNFSFYPCDNADQLQFLKDTLGVNAQGQIRDPRYALVKALALAHITKAIGAPPGGGGDNVPNPPVLPGTGKSSSSSSGWLLLLALLGLGGVGVAVATGWRPMGGRRPRAALTARRRRR